MLIKILKIKSMFDCINIKMIFEEILDNSNVIKEID